MIRFFALLLILANCEADHISTESHWALPMRQHPLSFTAWSGPSPESPGWPEHSLSRALSSAACPFLWGSASGLAQVSPTLAKLDPGQRSQIHSQPLLILPIQTLSFSSLYWVFLPPPSPKHVLHTLLRVGEEVCPTFPSTRAKLNSGRVWHGMIMGRCLSSIFKGKEQIIEHYTCDRIITMYN